MTSKKRHKPRIRILIGQVTALGPGKVDLLDAIEKTGSISAAARTMGMSYRRAWVLVDTMNKSFVRELVLTATGGKGGGGAQVSDLGRDVLRRYREMEKKAARSVAAQALDFATLLRNPQQD
ncbi:winged helix-turn-helix domain-containing protein [Varunaivibrio sulfuroxidans]|uniref:Molybdate transport system regulatory protein n=1 Tax=Varunaivibrio sulfuroxidans TaxID=1773489 RepID=A0A4R3JFM0_9PROT|nr:LysR family transcriptional regulator [Varunaivibrio sulfuroxidans]TCS63480.1 molybdate transport system regulatory protein [Varunaivibrio sulfuroxidans]WES30375.1 LysR family transcriptional regulator [Varunaivibrio sulfuroxidans]